MKQLVYFAHPLSHYDTEFEKACIKRIENKVVGGEVFNPNNLWLERVYQARKENGHENPFSIFTELTAVCDMTVGVPFMDNVMGAGVFKECMRAYTEGKPVFVIIGNDLQWVDFDPNWKSLSVDETRERIKNKEM